MSVSNMPQIEMSNEDLAALVIQEKIDYERNSRAQRLLFRRAYRNFVGIFDEPFTRYTNRKKEFWNITQVSVLGSASKIYVDPRAINILPTEESDITKARIWGALIPFQLQQINFFQLLNSFSIDLSLFGTTVSAQDWTFKRDEFISDESGKKVVKSKVTKDELSYKLIPILNCYIDPTSENLQDAPSFIVETWHEVSELAALKDKYKFTADVSDIIGEKLIVQGQGKRNGIDLLKYQQMGVSLRQLEVPMVQIFWRWAKIRLSWVTKKKADEDTWVEGRIAVLGNAKTDDGLESARLLGIVVNPYQHGRRPFEECWYIKIPGRWYGLGNGEMLLDQQTALNRVKNQRADNNAILQNKMFKARRGAGLDNKSIAAAPGKVVTVQNMDDLQVLETGSAEVSSYNDEADIIAWTERLTHVRDVQGAKSATEAQIQEQTAGDYFSIVRRNINDYLKRVVWQFIELDKQYLEAGMVIRIVGEPADFAELDQSMGIPEFLRPQMPNMRFIEVDDVKKLDGKFDIEVDIDNSMPMNKALKLQAIQQMLAASIQDPSSGLNRGEVYKEWADAIGLRGSRYFLNTQNQVYAPMPGQQLVGGQGGATPQGTPTPGVPTNVAGIQAALQGRVGRNTLFEQNQPPPNAPNQ